jgi:putative DNA primase/helicase
LLPHDSRYFAAGGCDYAFDPDAKCPTWLALQQWQWGDDDEMRDFIEEWLAYCPLQSMQLQTFLFVVGEGGNAKSLLASVFDAVLGRTNVSHVPIEDLGKQFSLYSTIGKLANVISDAEMTDKLIESRLKQFTAGDPMRCDRKYRDALDALVASARVIAFGNAVPLFRDTSRAIMRRLRIAHAVVSVKGTPDRLLAQKLYAERAGILNRVIVAAKRLIARGEFAVPSACAKTEQDFWLSNSSTRMWLSEHTALSPGHFEPMDWLYTSYAMKMNKWGVEHPLWRGRLGVELRKFYADAIAAGDVQACRACREWVTSHPAGYTSGARPHGYLGIEVSMEPIGFDVDEEVPF